MSAARARLITTALAAALVLTACTAGGGPTAEKVRDTSNDVAFVACGQVKCEGSLQGARYEIVMPAKWNGTLLLYNHGYREAQPAPPDFAPVSNDPEPAPGWSGGKKDVGTALLAQGFALAGSSYSSNGWAVAEAVKDSTRLYEFFRDNIAAPNRVYVWGDSLGGLIATELAEQATWVNGAAPLCGAVAGLRPNMDLALDVGFAVRTLIYPKMKLTGFRSYEEAVRTWTEAAKRIVKAAGDVAGGGTAKVLTIAAAVDAPARTQRFDGSTVTSRVKGATEGVLTALGFATFGRYDVETRLGGNPSTNVGTDYSTRVSAADRSAIDQVTPGATARNLALLAKAPTTPADASARTGATPLGDPTGVIRVPTFSVHTVYDPLVLVQNEAFYARRAIAAGKQALLVQAYTKPPATYAEDKGAPYGAGHCNFTAGTRVGAVKILDDWVRRGVYPGSVSVAEAFGKDSGLASGLSPPDWPTGPDHPASAP